MQTTKSILDGGCYLTLRAPGLGGAAGSAGAAAGEEEYFLTLPTFFAHNLILGTLRMEIGDSASIRIAAQRFAARFRGDIAAWLFARTDAAPALAAAPADRRRSS